MRTPTLALLFVVLTACSSDEPEDPRARCLEARGAIVDGDLLDATATLPPDLNDELAKHRAALHRSLGEAFIERCIANGPAYADCVLGATEPDQRRRCDPKFRP